MRCRWGAIAVAVGLATSACAGIQAATDSPKDPSFDLKSVLPLDSNELAQATKSAESFAVAYETWRYDEASADYLGCLSPYTSADLLSRLAKSANTQDLVVARAMGHEVAEASAKILALRSVSKRELMFTARVNQSVTTTTKKTYTRDYTIWLTKSTDWRVTDVAPVDDAESDALWVAD